MNKYQNFKKSKKKVVATEPSNLFFRSSANGWSTTDRFYKYSEKEYICRNVKIFAGDTEFKIADMSYSDIDLGSVTGKKIPFNRYVNLDNKTSENAKFTVGENKLTVDIFLKVDENNKYSVLIR